MFERLSQWDSRQKLYQKNDPTYFGFSVSYKEKLMSHLFLLYSAVRKISLFFDRSIALSDVFQNQSRLSQLFFNQCVGRSFLSVKEVDPPIVKPLEVSPCCQPLRSPSSPCSTSHCRHRVLSRLILCWTIWNASCWLG